MHIKSFKGEIETSTDLDLATLYETLGAARIAAVHMKQTWDHIAAMLDATREEMARRNLTLPSMDDAATHYNAAWGRAIDRVANGTKYLIEA